MQKLLYLMLPCLLAACMSKQEAAKYVTLTPVVAPIADTAAWQPVNAGINPQMHRLQSPLGTIDLHDWTSSATNLNAPELLQFYEQWHQQTQASIQANQQLLVSEPAREQISLADIDFWQTTYRLRQPDQSRLRIEQLLGVVAGKPLQITVTIDDNVDARSYEELQAILVKQVLVRKTP